MKTKWTEITTNLRNSLDSGVFRIWVAPLEAEITTSGLRLTAPSAYMAGWIRGHLLAAIRAAAAPVLGVAQDALEIEIAAGQTANAQSSASVLANLMPRASQAELPIRHSRQIAASGQWRYRFEDFVTGASNNLAVAACREMCQTGQVRSLFVTSGPGLGKTHLAQAAGQLLSQSGQPLKIGYLTAEQFASQFVAAMRARDLEAYKQRLCGLDALLLEDVHFLQRKKAMQEFALAIIKNIQEKGGRVIFTSSFAPRQLTDLDGQLASQFCSGIIAHMDKPDAGMRREILARKAKTFQVSLPDEVAALLSERLSSDVRQLESCLQNMVFKARLLNSGLTLDLALETIGEYAGAEPCLDLNAIVRLVCESFGLTEMQLRSRSRKHDYVQGRNTVFYLARKHTEMSLDSIGSALNRKHSTVMRSITQVEQEMARDSREGRQIARAVALIERRCGLAEK
ncbi:MAG: ATP-binding protein [Desulfovibrio sp.]|nr:ATP-binding protein [Desulfovibrio sp.]